MLSNWVMQASHKLHSLHLHPYQHPNKITVNTRYSFTSHLQDSSD